MTTMTSFDAACDVIRRSFRRGQLYNDRGGVGVHCRHDNANDVDDDDDDNNSNS